MSEDNLDDLIATEIANEDKLSVEGKEFMELMAEHGLIVPKGPSLFQRIKRLVAYPFKLIYRGVAFAVWHLGGKVVYRARLEKQKRRMQQLAGVGPFNNPKDNLDLFVRPERVGTIGYSTAAAEHEHIIKTKIVREELPKPDYEDGGELN